MQPTLVANPLRGAQAPESTPAIIGQRVELQLLTTLRCNLHCAYCSLGVGDVLGSQREVHYSLEELDAFIAKHLAGREIYVTFYGGEPTLNRDFIVAVMEHYPAFRFQLQTNGTLLDKLSDSVLARLSNILISIDGGEIITDGYRGEGIYHKVMNNVATIRGRVGGTMTARVTWSDPDTSFEELDALTGSFDYVYFQFVAKDTGYSPSAVAKKRRVLSQLVARFFSGAALYPMIPIMGVVRNKVLPARTQELHAGLTQCRVSTHLLNVMPDGRIYPCPDMMYAPEMLQGDVRANWLKRSPLQPHSSMPCANCPALPFCRHNCMKNLYLAYVKGNVDYRRKVVEPICSLVRFLGDEVDRHDPHGWFARASLPVRNLLANCEVYEYVEIMP
jgi:uncharacterized protein